MNIMKNWQIYFVQFFLWSHCTSQNAKTCDYPRIPNGGLSRTYEYWKNHYFPRSVGQTIDFRCSQGFLAENKEEWHRATCTKTGFTPEPKCFRQCGITHFPNGHFNAQNWAKFIEGEETTFTCNDGYVPLHKQTTITCTETGWSPALSCIKDVGGNCGHPPAIENGDFLGDILTEYEPGSRVHYQCQNIYKMEGSPFVRCENGHWTDAPTCIDPCTVTIEDMEHNNIQLRWKNHQKLYVESGDAAEFTCKQGYVQDPSSPPFRTHCREGKLVYPRCI